MVLMPTLFRADSSFATLCTIYISTHSHSVPADYHSRCHDMALISYQLTSISHSIAHNLSDPAHNVTALQSNNRRTTPTSYCRPNDTD